MWPNPFLRTRPPWGDLELRPDAVAVLVVDTEQWHPASLEQPVSGKAAYVMGIGQAPFSDLCRRLHVERLDVYQMRVDDLSCLADIPGLTHLAIRWNSRLESLDALCGLKLETLVLEDTPKIRDLEPLVRLPTLERLTFSAPAGSNANRVDSLAPLAGLPRLRELDLTNTRVASGGLLPLAGCHHLRRLVLSNHFPTEQYAFLSARLPGTECSLFAPWVHVGRSTIDETEVMITGSRKPFLDSSKDGDRIRKYEQAFAELRSRYAADAGLEPHT